MTLDDARKLWASGGAAGRSGASEAELLRAVVQRSAGLQRSIRRRDVREMVAAVVALLLLAPVLVKGPWLARAGVLVIAAGCALIIAKLGRARRLPAPGADWPLAEALRAERSRVEAQIRLLETVLWWYVAPLVGGAILVVLGLSGLTRMTISYALVAAALSAGVYWLNRRAVTKHLRPRKAELDGLIARLENG